MIEKNHSIGLATDVGGGSSFSMLRTMSAAYEIAQLKGQSITPLQLLWLSTLGAAKTLKLDHCIGSLNINNHADFIILNLKSTPLIEKKYINAVSFEERLFSTIILGDDRAIDSVWVKGQKLK